MKNQRSSNVTQIMVRRVCELLRRARTSLGLARLVPLGAFGALGKSPGAMELELRSDRLTLRNLEAEIYALTDQFNTEQDLKRAKSA